MTMMINDTVEGEVITTTPSATRLPKLCRLLGFEDEAEHEFQIRSMEAAEEITQWYEQPEVWQSEMLAIRKAEAVKTGLEPRWSATSERGFAKWVGLEVAKVGIEYRRSQVLRLHNAGRMQRIVSKVVPAGTTLLPTTESAWRPAMRLYSKGFDVEIADAVLIAAEIAESEAKPITDGIMRKAVAEVWETAPRIREWVEQPGQTVDPRSAHDRVVTALNKIKKEANELRKELGDNPKAWDEFLAGLATIK